jgi:hypothetical protein
LFDTSAPAPSTAGNRPFDSYNSAGATRGNGSKGMSGSGGHRQPSQTALAALLKRFRDLLPAVGDGADERRSERALELITAAVLIGGALLVLSEFLTLFEIDSGSLVVKQQTGGPHHAYAMLLIGSGTIAAALLARSTGARPPAVGVVVLSAVALLLALAADLPDATRSDLVRGARIADASPAAGFWVELAGALIALLAGLALARLLGRTSGASRPGT